jgi:hypothetical protein
MASLRSDPARGCELDGARLTLHRSAMEGGGRDAGDPGGPVADLDALDAIEDAAEAAPLSGRGGQHPDNTLHLGELREVFDGGEFWTVFWA